ncbi:hypothetical protein [Lysobacter sp. P5_B9]
MTQKASEVVSTVVRFHDMHGLGKLERAIQSLHAQIEAEVQPIVVTQRLDVAAVDAVRAAVERQWFFEWMPKPVVINYTDSSDRDVRSDLLNAGIAEHNRRGNRYLAFLDYDDLLYTHAYKTLKEPLSSTAAAVSFAGMEMAHAVGFSDYDFVYSMSNPFKGKNKLDLIKENFAPLHSYLIDCSKVDKSELRFRSDLIRVEDYEFLLRVAGRVPCDFSNMKIRIGAYLMRSDESNSTPKGTDRPEDMEKQEIWKSNRKLLDRLRSAYEIKFFASDF